LIYIAIIEEVREFVYVYEATDCTDAINKFIALDPKQAVPSYASILQGPTQIELRVPCVNDASRGQNYYHPNMMPPLIQGTPTFTNPFTTFYTATLREIRFTGYTINCDPSMLQSMIVQLNPSIDTLPEGVTIAMALQQSTVRPVYLYDPNGDYVSWWV
jgi:hypothetical protein